MNENSNSKLIILKNIIWLLVMLGISLSASVAIMHYFDDTIKFIDETALPDTPTAYLMGGFFAAFFGKIFNILVFIAFSGPVFVEKKRIMPSLFLFQQGESRSCRVWRSIGYIIIILFIYNGIKDAVLYKEFILSGLWYYISAILTAILYTIVWLSIISKEYHDE